MLNAGAILSAGVASTLVEPDMTNSEKFDYIQQYFKVSNVLANAGCFYDSNSFCNSWRTLLKNFVSKPDSSRLIEEFLSHLVSLARILEKFL